MDSEKSVVIVGGGLVGSLSACFFAKRGYKVALFEKRDDLRLVKSSEGRSINLALSNRGRKALRSVGLEEEILLHAIPMKGRLLHGSSGSLKSVLYDPRLNQSIYSVSRNFLNRTLIEAACKSSKVQLYFNHKVLSCNQTSGQIEVLNSKTKEKTVLEPDLIIGADGAFSTIRKELQTTPLFQFSQTYIAHGYLELSVPPSNGHLMQPNHLHIWPRGQFMMIALPNQDNSWTVTLFMPFDMFKQLSNDKSLIKFFTATFPDALNLIGQERLVQDFFKGAPSALVSIKCNPYHFNKKILLIGDAAHAMVPFYGQGMNAGFEDCTILEDLLDKNRDGIEKSIEEFSQKRLDDAQAICDLAMYNYVEMRDLVVRPSYKVRKMVDDWLFQLFPELWIPLYNSVTFSQMGYEACVQNRKWQDKILKLVIVLTTILLLVFSFFILT